MTPEDDSAPALTGLLAQYKEACGSPQGGANFMPELWARIEAKRSRIRLFERTAKSLFAVAVALSLVLGAFLMVPTSQPSAFFSETFVERIASDNTTANGTFFEPVRLELTATERHPNR
jgi:hypothetical protein